MTDFLKRLLNRLRPKPSTAYFTPEDDPTTIVLQKCLETGKPVVGHVDDEGNLHIQVLNDALSRDVSKDNENQR